jgi:hypothetical protein
MLPDLQGQEFKSFLTLDVHMHSTATITDSLYFIGDCRGPLSTAVAVGPTAVLTSRQSLYDNEARGNYWIQSRVWKCADKVHDVDKRIYLHVYAYNPDNEWVLLERSDNRQFLQFATIDTTLIGNGHLSSVWCAGSFLKAIACHCNIGAWLRPQREQYGFAGWIVSAANVTSESRHHISFRIPSCGAAATVGGVLIAAEGIPMERVIGLIVRSVPSSLDADAAPLEEKRLHADTAAQTPGTAPCKKRRVYCEREQGISLRIAVPGDGEALIICRHPVLMRHLQELNDKSNALREEEDWPGRIVN